MSRPVPSQSNTAGWPSPARLEAGRLLPRLLFFTLVWLILAGPGPTACLVGLPVVLLATWLSLRLAGAPFYLSPGQIARFLPWFLFQSLLSGLDVMARVLWPRPRISPGLLTYQTRLSPGPAQTFFANIISLLPGTLSAELQGRELTVHCLDRDRPVKDQLTDLEERIAALFACPLDQEEQP